MSSTTVKIIINNDNIETAQLVENGNSLQFIYQNINIIADSEIPHIALNKLREKLENQNILLTTEGCRKDVHASGMQMDMRTHSAYILTMGEPAQVIVDILSQTKNLNKISTIEEQELYYKMWLDNLRRSSTNKKVKSTYPFKRIQSLLKRFFFSIIFQAGTILKDTPPLSSRVST